MNQIRKDYWDKAQVIFTLLIPLMVAVVGYSINSTLGEQELGATYVDIAVEVLSAPPTHDTTALRDWAIEVLRNYSPIELTEAALEQLRSKPLPGSFTSGSGFFEEGFVEPGFIE